MTVARMALALALAGLVLAVSVPAAQTPFVINAQPSVTHAEAAVQVFGRIPTNRGGEDVAVEAFACGDIGIWIPIAKVQTTSLGAWTASTNVAVTTRFRAHWRGITSSTATVRVHPSILLDVDQRRHLLIVVRGNDRFEHATLQRRRGRRWVALRAVTFGANGVGAASAADIRLRFPRPTAVRLALTAKQVGRCYLPTVSDPITIR